MKTSGIRIPEMLPGRQKIGGIMPCPIQYPRRNAAKQLRIKGMIPGERDSSLMFLNPGLLI